MHAKKQSAKIFLQRIQENLSTKTDPMTMRRIFTELKLDDFQPGDTNFLQFLKKLCNEPLDITLLIEKVVSTILEIQPLCELFAYIQDNKLISDSEIQLAKNFLQKHAYLLCFCEAFTITMTNSPSLIEDIYYYFVRQRKSPRPGSPFITFFRGMPRGTKLFERLKIIATDRPIFRMMIHKSTTDKEETKEDI